MSEIKQELIYRVKKISKILQIYIHSTHLKNPHFSFSAPFGIRDVSKKISKKN